MNSEKKSLADIKLSFIILLLILSCVFLGSLNMINRYYYFIYIALLLLVVTPNRKMLFNFEFLVLMLFSLSLLIFDPSNQTMFTNMIKPFTYPLCYFMGLNMFVRNKEKDNNLLEEEKKTSTVIYVVTGGVMLHFILNMITNKGINTRHVIDFWTKDGMSATGQATLACLMIAIAIAFLFSKVGKLKKIIAIVSLILILSYNLILAGRTIFVLILIAVGTALLYTMFVKKFKSMKTLVIVLLIVLILVALYNSDVFGVKTSFEDSNFYDRFFGGKYTQDIDDDSRLSNKMYYVEHFFDSMLGGGHIKAEFGHSAHDLYLDTYDEAGIFALLAIAVYIIGSIWRAFKCALNKSISFETRILVLCIYVIVNIQFWMEPIIRGIPWLLAAYCLIDGAVTRLLITEKNTRVLK